MKTVTIEKEVYEFNELSDSAKQQAITEYAIDYDWHDFVYEDAKTIGALMGIDITNIYFSGFCSQGDGACFEGGYGYKKNSVNAVKEYAPELHDIAQTLFNIQKRNFFQLYAGIKHSGFYYHEFCTIIDVERDSYYGQDVSENDEKDLQEALRDFMKWIYKQLENEHDYLTSEEYFSELCQANEWNFYETGEMANL